MRTLHVWLLALTFLGAATPFETQSAVNARRDVHDRFYSAVDFFTEPGVIQRLLVARQGDVLMPSSESAPNVALPAKPRQYVEELTCQSLAVFEGRAISGTSRPTADGGGVYTEWEFRAANVLKDPKGGRGPGSSIFLLRKGGTVRLEGRQVRFAPPAGQVSLEVGKDYLIFASRVVPDTGAFADDLFTFAFVSDRVAGKPGALSPIEALNRGMVVNTVNEAAGQQVFQARCKR